MADERHAWIRPIGINNVSECMSVGIPFVSVYYY